MAPNKHMQRTCQPVTHFACAKCAPGRHAADVQRLASTKGAGVARRPIRQEEIHQKVAFAERGMTDLLSLNDGNLPGAPAFEKHLLAQEFFFHLIGAVEFTAQYVNDACDLGVEPDEVRVGGVLRALGEGHPVRKRLASLYASPRKTPVPADPYSPEGLVYRAYNYRHQVTHRRANPFLYRVGSTPPASFILDPRTLPQVPSERSLREEMTQMLQLIREGCQDIMVLAGEVPGGSAV